MEISICTNAFKKWKSDFLTVQSIIQTSVLKICLCLKSFFFFQTYATSEANKIKQLQLQKLVVDKNYKKNAITK